MKRDWLNKAHATLNNSEISRYRIPDTEYRIPIFGFQFPVLLKYLFILLTVILLSGCLKEVNTVQNQSFIKFYGNSINSSGSDVKQTIDGGYILVGTVATNERGTDIFLVKTDANGNQVWDPKYFGGNLNDTGFSVQITSDGGYIIAGSKNIDTNGLATSKIYVVKTNAIGDTLWTRVIGGEKNDVAYFVQLNGSSGYLITGYTESYGSGGKDAILISLDLNGNTNWMRTYGNNSDDVAKCVQITKDGFILIGSTKFSSQSTTNIFLIRTNSIGLLLQTAIIGGNENISGEYIQTLPNGGFIGIGTKYSAINASSSIHLFKLGNEIDSVLWYKDYGTNTTISEGKSVQITSDNKFAIIGTRLISSTNSEFYFIKTDSSGNQIFSRFYGQSGLQKAENFEQTKDNGFVMIGTNNIEENSSITLIKVLPDGTLK